MKLKQIFVFLLLLILSRAVSQNPVYEWANSIGSTTASAASGVVIKADAAGNIYLTGIFKGALDVDPSASITNVTSYAASQDFFLAKYSNTGALLWAKTIGGAQADECNGLTIDNAGNILITGLFKGVVDLDPGVGVTSCSSGTLTGDVFFEKLDASGNMIWVHTLSNASQKNGYAITTDQNNNVIITGYFYGVIDFDPGPAVTNYTNLSGNNIYYIAKYDANGNYMWVNIAQQFTGDNFGRSLVCDNNNNIFFAGEFDGQLDFDPSSSVNLLTSGGGFDVFFSKFDAAGNLIFVNNASGGGNDALCSITLDANNNIFIAG
ncbi:MAG: SBBP repeat-containing protein, partial [Bacteroidia bacterium]